MRKDLVVYSDRDEEDSRLEMSSGIFQDAIILNVQGHKQKVNLAELKLMIETLEVFLKERAPEKTEEFL